MIENNKEYKIKGKSKYFKGKYGTSNPVIKIENEDINVFNGGWMWQKGNPVCLIYAMRSACDNIPDSGKVYYGKIGILGELVNECELQIIAKGGEDG